MSSVVRKVVITDTTTSSNILSGSLICSGGVGISGLMDISGSIQCNGTITGNTLSVSNVFTVTDGANTGTIDQVSTELTLSSSGNRVAIASGNTLEFKNDGTSQLSAYTGREVIDECEICSFVLSDFTPVTCLSSTFSMNQAVPTTLAISVNTIYAYPVRLIKGQVVDGAAFYMTSVSGSPSIAYGLYSTANPGVRLAVTGSAIVTSGLLSNRFSFVSSYTVPTTGIYYICLYATSVGGGVSILALAANSYMNYGLSTMTTGVLNKAAQTGSIAGGLPSTLTGVTMTLATRVAYAIVYT